MLIAVSVLANCHAAGSKNTFPMIKFTNNFNDICSKISLNLLNFIQQFDFI